MGMCAFTCCTPCWCAAGFGTATAPLCCCKNCFIMYEVKGVDLPNESGEVRIIGYTGP